MWLHSADVLVNNSIENVTKVILWDSLYELVLFLSS